MPQQLPCPKCQKGRLYIPDPVIHFDNFITASIVVMAHEKPINCRECDGYFVQAFGSTLPEAVVPSQIAISMTLVGVPAPQQASDIVIAKQVPKGLVLP